MHERYLNNRLAPQALRDWAAALDKKASEYEPIPDDSEWGNDDGLEWLYQEGLPAGHLVARQEARERGQTECDLKIDADYFSSPKYNYTVK